MKYRDKYRKPIIHVTRDERDQRTVGDQGISSLQYCLKFRASALEYKSTDFDWQVIISKYGTNYLKQQELFIFNKMEVSCYVTPFESY